MLDTELDGAGTPTAFLARRPKSWSAWALLLLTLLLAPSAGAQSAENIAAARQLGAKGVTLARTGQCTQALDPLRRAEALYHAPTILVELGYCQCELGQLVEGTESLNRVVREQLDEDSPEAFHKAQAKAKQLLAEYSPKVAKLVIEVTAPGGKEFEVTVDDKPVAAVLLGVPRPTDPGKRVVKATGPGLLPQTATVELEPGGSDSVQLVLEIDSTVDAPKDEEVPGPEGPSIADSPPPREEPDLLPAYISFGVGAVGLGVGSYFGIQAMSQQGDLDERCRGGACPEGSQEDIDAMTQNANLSTIGFGVGLLGVGAGVYFLLTAEDGSQARCDEPPCVRPLVGVNHLGMEGEF